MKKIYGEVVTEVGDRCNSSKRCELDHLEVDGGWGFDVLHTALKEYMGKHVIITIREALD